MTASSTRRSRGVSSSEVAIRANILTTSAMRQGGREGVQPQPAEGGAAEPIVGITSHPLGDFPWGHEVTLAFLQLEPGVGAQTEIHGLGQSVRLSQLLLAADRVAPLRQRVPPVAVGSDVPSPDAPVEAVRGGTEADVGD